MSHEIETMAFTGDVPWHGLGKSIDFADVGDFFYRPVRTYSSPQVCYHLSGSGYFHLMTGLE